MHCPTCGQFNTDDALKCSMCSSILRRTYEQDEPVREIPDGPVAGAGLAVADSAELPGAELAAEPMAPDDSGYASALDDLGFCEEQKTPEPAKPAPVQGQPADPVHTFTAKSGMQSDTAGLRQYDIASKRRFVMVAAALLAAYVVSTIFQYLSIVQQMNTMSTETYDMTLHFSPMPLLAMGCQMLVIAYLMGKMLELSRGEFWTGFTLTAVPILNALTLPGLVAYICGQPVIRPYLWLLMDSVIMAIFMMIGLSTGQEMLALIACLIGMGFMIHHYFGSCSGEFVQRAGYSQKVFWIWFVAIPLMGLVLCGLGAMAWFSEMAPVLLNAAESGQPIPDIPIPMLFHVLFFALPLIYMTATLGFWALGLYRQMGHYTTENRASANVMQGGFYATSA